MASEYLKWLARNEKPEEKRELTPAEKRANWWHYHKWQVFFCLLIVAIAVSFILESNSNKRNGADYQIAYIGTKLLPDDTIDALEKSFAFFGEDISGDGITRIQVNQYILNSNELKATEMIMDFTSGNSVFYLMEDPERIQKLYGPLAYADGVFGDNEHRTEKLWYLWSECPALASLDLGEYETKYEGASVNVQGERGLNQNLLGNLYIGRRGIDENVKNPDACNKMWCKIIEGTAGE